MLGVLGLHIFGEGLYNVTGGMQKYAEKGYNVSEGKISIKNRVYETCVFHFKMKIEM